MPRALKISAWILGSLVVLVVLLIGALLIIGNTGSGRALIVRMTSRMTHGHVELAGIGGTFPAALDLDKLELRDDRGAWLVADHISLRWSPLALLARHIQVDLLHIGRLHIERAPVSAPKTKTSTSTFSIPHSDLAHVDIDTLELGPDLAGAATSLTVHGNAHWRSMQDAVASLKAQRTGGVGDYEATLRFDADRMDATLKLHEPAHGPLESLLNLPGLGDLSVLAQLNGPRTLENIAVTLDAGALKARVKGTVNLQATSGDLDYALTADQMTPRTGLSWQSVDIQGRWHGPLSSPTATGHLLIRQLQIPGDTQLASLTANLTASGGSLDAKATLEGLVIPGSRPDLFQDAPLTVDASAHLKDPKRPVEITAAHRLFTLQAHAITAGEQSARLNLHIPDVKPFAAVANEKVSGDATVKAQVTLDTHTTRLSAEADANLDGGTASWAGLVRGGTARLQLAGVLTDTKVTIDKLALAGRAVSVGASGSISRAATRDLDARLNVDLPDLKQLSPTFDGTLKLSGRVNGPRTSLSTAADLTTTLSIRGSPKGTVSASVRADGLPKAPRGTVEAHGDLDGAPLQLNVALERANGDVVHAVIRHADWKSAHIEGDLSSGPQIAQARGNLQLRMSQLADFDRLLGSNLQGSVLGNVKLTPAPRRSQAQIDLEAHDVVAGSLTANAKMTATGPMDALAIHLEGDTPSIGGKPASITSAATLNSVSSELRLSSLEAKYHDQTVRLLNPATVSYGGGLSIHDLRLGAQQAVLELDGRLSPTLDARASLQQVKPDLINAFVPDLLAGGIINGNALIQGSTAAPKGKLHVDATGLRAANNLAAGLPAVDIHADADLMETTAAVNAQLTAGNASHLVLSGQAPISNSGMLDLKFAGTLDLGLLNPITEASGRHVTGALTIDTTVSGAAAAPEIGGTVRLANGSVRDYTQGVNLTDMTGTLTGSHGTLQIQELTAKAAPGNVALSGTIGILQTGLPVDIKLTAKNAQPIASKIVTANLNADIQVTGTARNKLDVIGKVNVNRANVQIPSSFPPNVAVLDVRRPGEAPPPPPEKPLIVALNITVDAPRQILVKGRGLDAELGGEIRVRGTTDAPVVGGSFDLQRGNFTLGSSQLTFTQGSVTFNGEGLKKKIDPTLDFVAQTQVADITATIKITGFADSPKIELSSTPDLPQDEIMARLLFGESASQLTALQVVQIGAALSQLTGGGGGLNPLAKLQKTLGLDRLTVGTGPSTGTNSGTTSGAASQQNTGYSVEAGRYVSSRVFVAVKESTTGYTQLAVDVDLTKHLKLQTRIGNGSTTAQGTTPENDPGSSVGLAYQFEY
jgi:translocation and assembly module TamB